MLRSFGRFTNIQSLAGALMNRTFSEMPHNTVLEIKVETSIEKAYPKVTSENKCTLHERNHPLLADPYFEGVAPMVTPTFNLASYVNKSEFLQAMVKLGVSTHKWEKKGDIHSWVMMLDFNNNVKPIIRFLVDQGVPSEILGKFFTKNPYILKLSLDELETRTRYLQSKNFTSEMISRIYSRNPFWLQFSVTEIDSRLGFFQQTFDLSGQELRELACKEPRLITRNLQSIKMKNFGFQEEMGFEVDQIKKLLMTKPKLWIMNPSILVDRFDYLHNVVKMEHESILHFPSVLTCRDFRIKQRHEFLVHLKRAQYDAKLPNYISPLQLIRESDAHFAVSVAKSSVQEFNDFCKTM